MLKDILQKELSRIQRQSEETRNLLAKLPEGKLICCKGKYPRYFCSARGRKEYIKSKDRKFAEDLALRRFYETKLKDLSTEQTKLLRFLKELKEPNAEKLLQDTSLLKPLLSNIQPLSEELSQWQNEPFNSNPYYPEKLIVKCYSGHYVRSKSEAFIANYLYINQIPYRYECELIINNHAYYPDFTIRHPKTGKIYYYEHFGRMDDPDYAGRAFRKMEDYNYAGIVLGVNLLTTYENDMNPLDTEYMEKMISHYFLS